MLCIKFRKLKLIKNPRIMKISSEDDKSNGGDAYDDVSDTIHEDDDSQYYLSP